MSSPRTKAHGRLRMAAALLGAVLPAFCFGATRGELDQLLDDLTAWLPGEYSSAPLVRLEEESGVTAEKRHPSEFWILARVDTPKVGSRVFLQQLHTGNAGGDVALQWQMLHALRIDAPREGVVVDSAEWLLSADELWIRDEPAPAVAPADRQRAAPQVASSYLRLFKSRRFGCSWQANFGDAAPTTSLFELHDRGGEYRVEAPTGGGRLLRLMRGPVPTERLRGQREVTSLAVVGASNGRIFAESRMSGQTDYITLRFADQFIECARR